MAAQSKYMLGIELGRGAYGTVFEITDKFNGTKHALKQIPMKVTDDGISQSIIREISTLKSLQRLQHPNVVRLDDVFLMREPTGEIHLNLIYEKCDMDLRRWLTDIPHTMPDNQCRHYAKQILSGVAFLHEHAIVHRDIKPENILIDKSSHTIKLTDFGLARNYGLVSGFTTLTVTLWYRAPEVLLQCKYNTSVDVWSAGCVIAELYSRKALFQASTEQQQLEMIFQLMGTPPVSEWPRDAVVDYSQYAGHARKPLQSFLPNITPTALDLVLQTLSFSPNKRPTASSCLLHGYFAPASR
ncbi:CMGC/CDK/CDK4 protein kinase [Aphelenchoides avenae]|nr:CMGC/CDK/CDK4 protein kinase [Aphelenchus avenae]